MGPDGSRSTRTYLRKSLSAVKEVSLIAKWFNIGSIEYAVAICMTKLAVLWLYRRVFSPQRNNAFDSTILSLIIIFISYYGSTILVKIFECSPRSKIADKTIPGTCINLSMLINADGVFNTITDVIILLLPIKAVWKLNIKKQKKVIVILVFTFGLW